MRRVARVLAGIGVVALSNLLASRGLCLRAEWHETVARKEQ